MLKFGTQVRVKSGATFHPITFHRNLFMFVRRELSRIYGQFFRIRKFMENMTTNLIYISSFTIIALASKQIGVFFAKIRLPKITGYLFTGLVTGAFVLGFFPENAVRQLHFVDNISLAFIAFAAG